MSDIGHNNPDIDIAYSELREILDELADSKREQSEAAGRHRRAIKQIIEDREWHKGAFADIRKIEGMSEAARADYLRTFEPLFALMMKAKWQAEKDDLLSSLEDGESEGEEGGEEEPEQWGPEAA